MAIFQRKEAAPAARRPGEWNREWDPFQMMREMMRWDPFQELTPRFSRGGEERFTLAPAFDVRESKDAYIFKADLPGFREADIDISVTGNRLTVSGKRAAEHVEDSDTYYCCERSYGSFSRSFTLPEGVNAEQVHADLKDGILSLQVPKTAETQPRRIQLRGNQQNGGEEKAEA